MNDQLVKREDVAKRLKLLIKVNNLSNAAFASAANVPRTSLQQALKGTTQSISNEYLARIALRFGVDMDWLLMGREHFLTVPMRRALSEASRALDAEAEASRGRTAE